MVDESELAVVSSQQDGDGEGAAAAERALQNMARCRNGGDAEGLARAVKDLVAAQASDNHVETASELVASMIQETQDTASKSAQGYLLTASARLHAARESGSQALDAATRAIEILRDAGDGSALAGAVEAVIDAHSIQSNPQAGLRAANLEAEAARKRSDKTGEVLIQEAIVRAHAALGNPQSAISAAERAVELNRALGKKEAEGSLLNTIAEMKWAMSELGGACEYARQSMSVFSLAGCKWGEDQARKTLTGVLAARGLYDKAPNRKAALGALKELAKAVTEKNAEEVKAAEERLNEVRDAVSDREIVEHLSPIMQKMPETVDFLKACGWNLGGAKGLEGTQLKHYSHKGFYLSTLMSGMGFGPQFRPVYEPWKRSRSQEDEATMAMSVLLLPETESWQSDMSYRPGILDGALQQQNVFGFP